MGCLCSKGAKDENSNNKYYNAPVQLIDPSPTRNDNVLDDEDWHSLASEKSGNGGGPGWPSWLASVAGEAVQGWQPRRAESFQKLEKIGEGTYSSVYKARDLETGKIVAMKKVRFLNMDPGSIRFMAREITILRKLDHPNIMKLEGVVASKKSCSLHLVFEYMEHDLAGLAATPGINFTESQIKCYMRQLFLGLQHCHSNGVLHRDIKGSNVLIDNNGVLKIADFGLANFFQADQKQPLTSHVVTLWYRAPELLLGATEYGAAIDLWSSGCILAELFTGKPIMPGRTEVEQMHKIFKLCGSPSEKYWQKTKLPHAISFKPQKPYKRLIAATFKNFPQSALSLVDKLLAMEPQNRGSAASALRSPFFRTEPLPCDPSSLPKYPPSKELDIKQRDDEARRKRAESVRRGSRDAKAVPTPDFIADGQSKASTSSKDVADGQSKASTSSKDGDAASRLSNSLSMINRAAGNGCDAASRLSNSLSMINRTEGNGGELRTQMSQAANTEGDRASNKDPAQRKKKMHYSGPVIAAGGNIEEMLKEHERQIQQAVRKARLDN